MSLARAGMSWLHQTLTWSNSWTSWQERLLGLSLFLLGALLAFVSPRIPLWQAAALWAGYFVGLAICSRQGWIRLIGPVLFYDMIRTARRSRYVFMRLLYALLLLLILLMNYLTMEASQHMNDPGWILLSVVGFFFFLIVQLALGYSLTIFTSRAARIAIVSLILVGLAFFLVGFFAVDQSGVAGATNARDTATLAETFVSIFLLVQLVMVVLLTPAYVAGAIAEEKDRKTLEFMLATDLTNREIVLSKLLSRLANMTLLMLTGLPILSVLQFIGGVDQQLLLAGFAGIGLTMVGIASVSILFSTLLKRPRDAIGLTYLFITAYMATSTVGLIFEDSRYPLMKEKMWEAETAPTFAEGSLALNSGNPIAAIVEIMLAIRGVNRSGTRSSLAAELPGTLARYMWFYVPLTFICILWSVLRLRSVALKQSAGGKTAGLRWWDRYRPPIGELPMVWKELNMEGGTKFNWLSVLAAVVLIFLTVGTGVLILSEHLSRLSLDSASWTQLSRSMHIWFQIAGPGVACLMILSVAVRASTSISSERERDTFDALVTSPLSSDEILGAKLLGSLTTLRIGWLWFSVLLVLAILTGGIHLLAVPIVLTAWLIYSLFFAMVGTWFSMVAQTSMRATVYTVLTTLSLSVGHWLFTWLCCVPIYAITHLYQPGDFPEYCYTFQLAMTPPVALGFFSYSWEELSDNWRNRTFAEYLPFFLVSLFLWAIACVIMWYGLLVPKFRQVTRREEMVYR